MNSMICTSHLQLRRLALIACLGMAGSLTALAEEKPECNPASTPPVIEGTVTAVSGDRITVRLADGSTHELQAGKDTTQNYKVGDHIKARLRTNPKCDSK